MNLFDCFLVYRINIVSQVAVIFIYLIILCKKIIYNTFYGMFDKHFNKQQLNHYFRSCIIISF